MNSLTGKPPALRRLKLYELALLKWKEHKGLEGQGGNWIASEKKYGFANCPTPVEFQIDGYEMVLAEKIRAQVLPGVKS